MFSSTSGENIGDSGLIQAYRAWKAQYEDSYEAGKEYLLPGLDYTRFVMLDVPMNYSVTDDMFREQLFFISFARTWAMNNKPADAVSVAKTHLTTYFNMTCNRSDVSGQTLIRRTDIALKAPFLIFLSLPRPLSAPNMPRQVRAREMQTLLTWHLTA